MRTVQWGMHLILPVILSIFVMDLLLFKRLKKDERDMSVHILVLHLFQINIVYFLLLLHFIWYQLLYMFTKKVFFPTSHHCHIHTKASLCRKFNDLVCWIAHRGKYCRNNINNDLYQPRQMLTCIKWSFFYIVERVKVCWETGGCRTHSVHSVYWE